MSYWLTFLDLRLGVKIHLQIWVMAQDSGPGV